MKNTWHNIQQYYFRFNRSDRNAITILATAIFILLIGTRILPHFISSKPEDFSEIKAIFEAWEMEQNKMTDSRQLSLFEFDPNTILESELNSLNLPFFVKQNMMRYREAGGNFKSADDLSKIYGMTDSLFQLIQPYVKINQSATKKFNDTNKNLQANNGQTENSRVVNRAEKSKIHSQNLKIELNRADSIDLVQLSGIGPVFSKRIIRYRELLGGFVKTEQLLEVYNFPPETYESILDFLEVDTLLITKLRINFADFSDLLRHPYLNNEQVSAIVNQRDKEGPFKNLSEIETIQVFDSESFARIRPYLTCQ